MNLDDMFIDRNVRTGPKPPSWAEVGTHSCEFTAEAIVEGAIVVTIHAWLKRHSTDDITISWSTVAARDNDSDLIGDPSAETLTASVALRGLLRGRDEEELRAQFKQIASKAATSCAARVSAAWGTGP